MPKDVLLTKGGDHSGKTHLANSLIIDIEEEESIIAKDHMLGAVHPFVRDCKFRSADVRSVSNGSRRFRLSFVCVYRTGKKRKNIACI